MGLIRKSLAIGTVGVVKPNSKKQRNQKELIKQAKLSNNIAAAQLATQIQAQAEAQQALIQAQAQTAYLQAMVAQQGAVSPAPPPAIPSHQAGWYPDPFGGQDLRWHDGYTWTDHVRAQLSN